jgi:putative CocE/NonD family hydrolase
MSNASTRAGMSGRARLAGLMFVVLSAAPFAAWAQTPDLEFRAPPAADDSTTPAVMRDLAERLLPVYQEPDSDRYLANLSALQMVAGDYAAADVSRQALRERRRSADSARPVGRGMIYDIYAYAKTIEAENRVAFAQAFTRSFDEVIPRLNDHDAYLVTRWFKTTPPVFRDALQELLDQQRGKDNIGQSEAVGLIWAYLAFSAYRNFAPVVDALVAEDDSRRYAVDNDALISIPGGARIAVMVVRPKNPSKPLPTLLQLTVYQGQNYAKECASHGYIGVVAYVRGGRSGLRPMVPYQHEGDDARAVINWIVKQPWSDGRVGMYGEGYSGFTAWAAAARSPSALKAIATSGATAPGVDFPMAGSIFQNSAYRWSLYMSTAKESVEKSYFEDSLWSALDQQWYSSGRRYRDLGRVHQQPNPIFIRWLNHPSYDPYWQKANPSPEQFARINIPVLTTTGYFSASEPGALYYFAQHTRYNTHADHTLLIGPYDDSVMQRNPSAVLQGYKVDPAALVDVHELQYQWFDHVFKGSATPPLLTTQVNYEVMGANEWRHGSSLAALSGESLKLYLDTAVSGEGRRLTRRKPTKVAFALQTVNLADRTDAGWMPPAELISKVLASHNSLTFVSEPLTKPTDISGQFSARLDFTVNRMDVDLNVMLYERLAGGDYICLFNPAYEFRASYASDRVNRSLLKAGERQELVVKPERITSRRLQAGSRLVMVLGINKRPDREINYGTGNDVSEESIADGKSPIKIRWYSDSYIEIPVRR